MSQHGSAYYSIYGTPIMDSNRKFLGFITSTHEHAKQYGHWRFASDKHSRNDLLAYKSGFQSPEQLFQAYNSGGRRLWHVTIKLTWCAGAKDLDQTYRTGTAGQHMANITEERDLLGLPPLLANEIPLYPISSNRAFLTYRRERDSVGHVSSLQGISYSGTTEHAVVDRRKAQEQAGSPTNTENHTPSSYGNPAIIPNGFTPVQKVTKASVSSPFQQRCIGEGGPTNTTAAKIPNSSLVQPRADLLAAKSQNITVVSVRPVRPLKSLADEQDTSWQLEDVSDASIHVPTSACLRCTRKEMRCDRTRPACSKCVGLGALCQYSQHSTPGESSSSRPDTINHHGSCGNGMVRAISSSSMLIPATSASSPVASSDLLVIPNTPSSRCENHSTSTRINSQTLPINDLRSGGSFRTVHSTITDQPHQAPPVRRLAPHQPRAPDCASQISLPSSPPNLRVENILDRLRSERVLEVPRRVNEEGAQDMAEANQSAEMTSEASQLVSPDEVLPLPTFLHADPPSYPEPDAAPDTKKDHAIPSHRQKAAPKGSKKTLTLYDEKIVKTVSSERVVSKNRFTAELRQVSPDTVTEVKTSPTTLSTAHNQHHASNAHNQGNIKEASQDTVSQMLCGHCKLTAPPGGLWKTAASCKGCTNVWYCNKFCRNSDWESHKWACDRTKEPKPALPLIPAKINHTEPRFVNDEEFGTALLPLSKYVPCMFCNGTKEHSPDCMVSDFLFGPPPSYNQIEIEELREQVKEHDPEQWREHENPPASPEPEQLSKVLPELVELIKKEHSYIDDPVLHEVSDHFLPIMWALRTSSIGMQLVTADGEIYDPTHPVWADVEGDAVMGDEI